MISLLLDIIEPTGKHTVRKANRNYFAMQMTGKSVRSPCAWKGMVGSGTVTYVIDGVHL